MPQANNIGPTLEHPHVAEAGLRFGGNWTDQKLTILRKYLNAYTMALKNKRFDRIYIDAFAGTGYLEIRSDAAERSSGVPDLLFAEQAGEDAAEFLDGSARIALETDPPFDRFVFIEKSAKRLAELRRFVDENPVAAKRTNMIHGDCNRELPALCRQVSWRRTRAVLFLDPFGMSVDWGTMKAVAETRAIDVWVLFPVGIGVNRLLTARLSDMDPKWADRLTRLFGTDEWKSALYKRAVEPDLLLGSLETDQKYCNCKAIVDYYLARLRTIFPGVDSAPKFLRNSRQSPMFALCFAVGNPEPRARGLALKLAKDVLRS
jgi:three-Cys-motif partner protein